MKLTKPDMVTWTWTNWTFGVWADRKRLPKVIVGVDLGPLELVWKKTKR